MIASDKKKADTINSKSYIWGLVIAWTVIITMSLLWNVFQGKKEALNTAHVQALVAYQKDVIYRRWSTMHGGIYVPVTEKTQPNPFLADIPERDIRTSSGKMLTLMNPAYMTRQVYEVGLEEYGVRAHITSLKPIRSENAPDSWETKALQAFERGEKEIYSVETIEDQKYFRLMSPLITEKGCLLCHARHGYKENDIRGGISVSIPMEPLRAISHVQLIRMVFIHAVLWLIGIAAIAFGSFQFRKSEQRRNHAEEGLKKANEELEKQVQVRTAELVKTNKALQQDITERKRAEEALRESERKYRELVENANSTILRWTRDGKVTFMNEFGQKFFGYSEAEILGRHVIGTIVPETESTGRDLRPLMDQICANPKAFERNVNENMRRDGSLVWIAWTNKSVLDSQGQVKEVFSVGTDITERKKAEELLLEKEHLLSEAQRIAHVGSWVYDMTGQISWSDETYRIYGVSPDTFTPNAESFINLIHPDERPAMQAWINACMAGEKPGELEFRSIMPDGTVRFISGRGELKYDAENKPTHMAGTAQDITEQKKAEEALWESEEKFSKAFHSNPAMLVLTTLDGKNLDVNQAYADFLGYSREEILGKNVVNLQIVNVEERQKILELIQQGGGSVHNAEIAVRVRDGSLRHILFSADVISLGSVPHRLTTLLDITERKKAEEERRIINEELLAINRIITTTTTTTGVKGILEKVLDEALYITGLEGGTICMVTPDETLNLAVHRETSEATILDLTTNQIKIGECLCGECARDHKPLILWDREAVLKFSSREAQRGEDIRFHAALPLITGGRCVGVLCVFTRTDKKPFERRLKLLETITSQIAIALENARLYEETTLHAAILEDRVKERTAELSDSQGALMNLVEDLNIKSSEIEKANLRLQELDQLKSMFIASMSHELRTPLNSIIGFTGIILQGMSGEVTEEQKKQLKMVQSSARHLLALINDVIDISKIEAGKVELSIKEFDLSGLVRSVKDSFDPALAEKGMKLSLEMPERLMIKSDERRTKQVLMNLVSNAIKFTDQGGVRVSVRLTRDEGRETKASVVLVSEANDRPSSIVVAVEDTGIGIKREDMVYLFEPFYKIPVGGRFLQEGTGLGLYLSKKIVDLLGGCLEAESEFGKGSKFIFTLPMGHEGRRTTDERR